MTARGGDIGDLPGLLRSAADWMSDGPSYADLLSERDRLRGMVAALEAEKDTALESLRVANVHIGELQGDRDAFLDAKDYYQRESIEWRRRYQEAADILNAQPADPIELSEQVRNLSSRLEEVTAERDEMNQPKLGLATTRQILTELTARIEIDGQLDYSTVHGTPGPTS